MSDKLTLKEAQKRLLEAAGNGDAETVAEMLAVPGIDVNKANDRGVTPLQWAAAKGHTEVVKLLLEVPGIDVNKTDDGGVTPLRWAAGEGYAEVVKLLLEVPGIDVNKTDKYDTTPLNMAAGEGYAEVVKLLLSAPGIDVNKEDDEGGTPLHSAASEEHAEVVKLLLSAPGIDVNKTDNDGLTPLERAEDSEVFELLEAAGAGFSGFDYDEEDYEEEDEEEEEGSEDETSVWEGEIRQMWEYKMYSPGTLSELLNVGERDRLMFVYVSANETSNEWGQEDEYIAIYLKREGGAWKDICWPKVPHDGADPHFPEEWNWGEILDQVWDGKTVTYTTNLNEDYEQIEATWEVEE